MEQFQIDQSGFNVIEAHPSGGMATVATLQPHARIKARAVLFAAAPDLLEALEAIDEEIMAIKCDDIDITRILARVARLSLNARAKAKARSNG